MNRRKRLQELTIKDSFMFAAVMMEEDNCRRFLEMALGFAIERVEVSYEKTILYHPEYKGVRLDVFAKDENHTRYNVEMQVAHQQPGRRSRYYHSQIDMEMLRSGTDYGELSDAYVIFICDYDPYDAKKYRYTFENVCREEENLSLGDGNHTVILSTAGENTEEVPRELVQFLKYVKAGLKESTEEYGDSLVSQLQRTVRRIKNSREMEERYMILEEMLKDEYAQGKAEGKAEGELIGRAAGEIAGRAEGKAESVLELLEELGNVPQSLREHILSETDIELLQRLLKRAAKAETLHQFEVEYASLVSKNPDAPRK
ncbi:MAG: Rpn family recombination-promoting nuclease/putative transposase [Eubacteriales bacterium]|nr:Rpn family recombination-promoting nuclease/putative transposase [Eubacteriales bacterium]